jgi:Tol biopolymer transport system component
MDRIDHGTADVTSDRHPTTLRSGAARLALALVLGAMAWVGDHAAAQDAPPISRSEAVVGPLLPQPVGYFTHSGDSGPNLITNDELARIAGFAVRQHPVNLGLFDSGGCAQCHRLAGPLPPDNDAPPDVFDQLPSPRVEGPVPEGFTRLTSSPAREEYPSWSPDGRTILYEVSDEDGRYALWAMDADGGDARPLTDHAAAGWADWHPNGDRIAYWAADEEGRANIWTVDVASGEARRLTDHEMTAWPRWSPDGRHLAYQARIDGTWRLRLLDTVDDRAWDLDQDADVMPSRPLWSPDGSELLYQSLVGTRFELTRLVFPVNTTGSADYRAHPTRIATTTVYPIDLGAAPQHPAWSPTDDRITFVMYTLQVVPPSTLAFSYKTWATAANGAHPRLLLPDGTLADRSPTWNADGSWLAQWSWNDDLSAGIWLIDADATTRIELTHDLGGDALYPAWSPDGSKIAFAANREGTFDIWIADVAATGVQGVTADAR